MGKPLRVLMVEDSEDDVLLTIRALKKGGFDPEYERVEDAGAMRKALQKKTWDVILCDYSMPQFNGLAAIALLKEPGIDIPLLIVSGAIGEETAVECMRSGASDYVIKGNLSRLVPAIERELKEAESRSNRKSAEDALRKSEENYRQLFDNAPAGIYQVDFRTGKFLKANDFICEYLGFRQEEITSLSPYDYLTKESQKLLIERLNKMAIGEKVPEDPEYEIVNRNGELRWLKLNVKNIYDSGGLAGADVVAHDITDRKQAEEALKKSENKYRLLADNVNDVIFVLDMNLNYTYVSPSVKILRGYEPEEVMKHSPEKTLTPSSWDQAVKTLSEVIELEKSGHREILESRTIELEMWRKDGTTVWTEVKFSFIRDENSRPVGILGVTREITDRKEAEQKLRNTLDSLRKAFGATIQVMVAAVEVRDPYTAGHQVRSANLARSIATEMGLPQEKIDGIRMAGSIHDIGKLSIPAEILSKPTRLTELEFSLIKEHSQKGYEMLKDVESPWPLAEMVYQHHERMDGSGYPRNLKGNEILMEARILAVADVVESMASHRPYRAALGLNVALEEIEKKRGIFYDNAVADACLRLFREKGYQIEGT
jgi:PAS domain S-box-containing protein